MVPRAGLNQATTCGICRKRVAPQTGNHHKHYTNVVKQNLERQILGFAAGNDMYATVTPPGVTNATSIKIFNEPGRGKNIVPHAAGCMQNTMGNPIVGNDV